ncbi:MAG: aminopeptidase [Halobacteriaceae archaeon]
MDPRIQEHAEILVDWSAQVNPYDNVIVDVGEGAHDLGVAVAKELGKRDANILPLYSSSQIQRSYLGHHSGDFEKDPQYIKTLFEQADIYLRLSGTYNSAEIADIQQDVRQSYNRSQEGIRDSRLQTDWVTTIHPTRALAQQAGMAYEAYQDFVYNAINRDWESLANEMANMKEILDQGDMVHIEKEDTDLTMSISNRTAVNSAASVRYDSHNLPSGEVFTAPTDPEGEIYFDVPMVLNGERVEDVHLTFSNGEVVDYRAERNESVLEEIITTDPGAKRLGELGIGMNRGIDRFTNNITFDEKMNQTIHLALGNAYASCVPSDEQRNKSAVHVDMITDMSNNATLAVDGEIIQRNGTFKWENGFEHEEK